MPKGPAQEFGHPDWYPYRSVCTISTRYVHLARLVGLQRTGVTTTMLGHYGAASAVATPELCEEVVRKHLQSNSAHLPSFLQDWMSMDGKWRNPNAQEERIVTCNPAALLALAYITALEQLMKAKA